MRTCLGDVKRCFVFSEFCMDRLLNGRRRLDSQGQRLPDEPDVFTFSCRKRNVFCVIIIVLILTIAIAVTLWKTIFEEHNNSMFIPVPPFL